MEIQLDSGSFVFSISDVITSHLGINGESGSFVFNLQDVNVPPVFIIPEVGSFIFSGMNATVTHGDITVSSESGAFLLAGSESFRHRQFEGDSGAFVFTGGDVSLTILGDTDYLVGADSGTFIFMGEIMNPLHKVVPGLRIRRKKT